MSRIDSPQFTPPAFDSGMRQPGTGTGGTGLTGQLAGEQVKIADGTSALADAAEEISLHHSEKAESKHHAERKKEFGGGIDLMRIEDIEAYLEAAQAFEDPEQLVALAKRMLGGQGDPGAEAKKAFDEPAGQYVALQYALQMGEQEGAPASVLEDIRDALADLEADHGPAIRASLNTIAAAAEGASGAGEVRAFQGTYRDVVLGDGSLSGTLKLALERFGHGSGADFATGLQRLVKALGQDLAAARPSGDPARLQNLVQDLYHLSVASTVLDGCHELQASQAQRHGGASGFGPGPVALMQDLVGVSGEKWVAASRFGGLAEKFGAAEPLPAINFLTGVKVLMREMPVKVFVDGDQRQSVFNAVQEALDTAIDREEY